jgi:hypothetical protein
MTKVILSEAEAASRTKAEPSAIQKRTMTEEVASAGFSGANLDGDRASAHVQALADRLEVVPVTLRYDTPKKSGLTLVTDWVVRAREPLPDVFGGTGGDMPFSQQLQRMVESTPEYRAVVLGRMAMLRKSDTGFAEDLFVLTRSDFELLCADDGTFGRGGIEA